MPLTVNYGASLDFVKKTTDNLLSQTEAARLDIAGVDNDQAYYYQDVVDLTGGSPYSVDLAGEGFSTISYVIVQGTSGNGDLTISLGSNQSNVVPANGGAVFWVISDTAGTLTIDPGPDNASCRLLVIGS